MRYNFGEAWQKAVVQQGKQTKKFQETQNIDFLYTDLQNSFFAVYEQFMDKIKVKGIPLLSEAAKETLEGILSKRIDEDVIQAIRCGYLDLYNEKMETQKPAVPVGKPWLLDNYTIPKNA